MRVPYLIVSTWTALLLGAGIGGSVLAAEPVSIESLLREMVDRDNVAWYPKTDFRLKQASSYNRASKTPDDPDAWFNNFDRNTSDEHLNFVRTEVNNGRKEWVVMEDEGAGVITRFWVPWRNLLKPGTDVVIRFYLDGASEPTIEGNMFELFQGKGLVPFPLAHESLRSAVSFFPVPYAKSCKVTMSDHPFFFQFTYREYKEKVDVKTFSMEDFTAAKPLIDTTCQKLLNPNASAAGEVVNLKETIAETIVLKPQNLKALKLKGSWNLDNHLLFKDAQVGDVVELRIPASSPSTQKLVLHATKSRDFGILRFTVNGKPVGADVDLYAAKPVPTGPIVLGNFEPVDSAYVLRVKVVGKNGKSKGTFFGLDCVVIERAQK